MLGSGKTLTLKRLKEFFVIAVYASPTLRLNLIKMLLDDDTKESFQKVSLLKFKIRVVRGANCFIIIVL